MCRLETRSRSVVATLIRSVLTRSVVLGRHHCFLVLVVTGCLWVRITQYLASVGEEQLFQTVGHGAATVSCHLWGRHQALDLIQLAQGWDRSQVALVQAQGGVHLAGETFMVQITTNLCLPVP